MNFVSTVCLRRSDTHGQQTCMFSSSRTGFLGSKFLGERNPPRVDESWLESSERQFQRRRTTWRASALHGRKPAPPRVLHRIFASLMYLIPYLDVLVFGEFVFRKVIIGFTASQKDSDNPERAGPQRQNFYATFA
uniref:Uncharacterized protein n=1 Tax=Rhodosorus marinus TaxID=101924 RepID=A0A7S2ZT21_9RHOD|mmetsp:Transcript_30864/g.118365  ORF Transcript_30864/g.118365 Transcript_30864/m.118365 type:complete len:135 (-) Transcript_30864:2029-2433(-)